MKSKEFYNADYFERGKKLGISNYLHYRWLPQRSLQEAKNIYNLTGINRNARIFDFGCAKGFLVKAFLQMGFDAYGCDISEYAIEQADPQSRERCKQNNFMQIVPFENTFDLIVAIHVLEHMRPTYLPEIFNHLKKKSNRFFFRVKKKKKGYYFNNKHNKDVSHIIAEDIFWWLNIFKQNGLENIRQKICTIENSILPDFADFMIVHTHR
jgi:2-polyprenyl-3-methyl-5-hydroxy-6-metoxy-1,4-benzoquinol methylase